MPAYVLPTPYLGHTASMAKSALPRVMQFVAKSATFHTLRHGKSGVFEAVIKPFNTGLGLHSLAYTPPTLAHVHDHTGLVECCQRLFECCPSLLQCGDLNPKPCTLNWGLHLSATVCWCIAEEEWGIPNFLGEEISQRCTRDLARSCF